MHHLKHLTDALLALSFRHLAHDQPVGNVLFDGHVGKQCIALKNHADVAFLNRKRRDVLVVEQHPTGVRRIQAGNQSQGGCLAAAGRAKQYKRFA